MTVRSRHARSVALLLALVLPVAASAQDAETGADYYAAYCATCHGRGGEGDGPTAELMTLTPTDLTRLSAANDGVFPLVRVVRRIDGRDPVLAHGSPMPVFGAFFETAEDVPLKTPSGQPLLTSSPVADLAAYIETLQAP